MRVESRPLRELIRLKKPFHFTYGPIPQSLLESVQKIGVMNPPIFYQEGHELILIHGARRIAILNEIDPLQDIPVKIIDSSEMVHRDAFDINLFENLSTRTLNPIEKSLILSALRPLLDEETILKDYMLLLDLAPTPEAMEQYQQLSQISALAKDSVARGDLQADNALFLLEFSMEDQDFLLSVITKLALGVNSQKQFLRLAWDISKKANRSFVHAYPLEDIERILSSQFSPSQKWARIEEALKHRRYPVLSQINDQYKAIRHELKIPPEISLQAPPYFEKEEYSIQFRFKNEEEFNNRISLLTKLPAKKMFQDLFKITLEL